MVTTPWPASRLGPTTAAPNEWQIYFAVEDTESVAAQARALGGDVILEPIETPIGPMATLADPQGAIFNVIAISAS